MSHFPRTVRNLVVFFVALPLTGSFVLSSASAQPRRQGLPLPKKTVLPDDGVEVEMLRYKQLPMIETKINGKGPFRLIVDTGAAGVVLKDAVAQKLDLPPPPGMAPGMQIQVRAPGSNNLQASLFYIDTLEIGAMNFEGLWTIGMELPFGDGMDGVIGMDVFNDCLLTYDYLNQRMSFKRGQLPEVNNRDVLSYSNPRMPNSHPEVELKVDGEPTKFLIDTGMRGWFAMNQKQMDQYDVIQGPVVGEMGMSAAGLMPSKVCRIGNSINVGAFSVEKPIVRSMTSNVAANIVGTFFLENFKVTFDAKNKRFQLAESKKKSFTPNSLRSLGFGLKKDGESYVVWYVHPDSHAARIGIQTGDKIIDIDGKAAEEIFENKDWQEILQDNEQLEVKYQGKDEKSAKTATLKILEILPAVE